jgi:hypothetical protein
VALIADLHGFQGFETYGGNVNEGVVAVLAHCIDSVGNLTERD